jgi:hypothetical protein
MGRNQRIALLVGVVAVAVVAFVIASPGGDDDSGSSTTQTPRKPAAGDSLGTDARDVTARIRIEDEKPAGGVKDIEVKKGDKVDLVVTADASDDVHLHGYDIEKKVTPGQATHFRFTADAEGAFEIESHKAEDAGLDPLLARLLVKPS